MADTAPHHGLVCANCEGRGTLACKGCLLVLYCGAECQKAHWATHKTDCKLSLNRTSWTPRWQQQKRAPNFISLGIDILTQTQSADQDPEGHKRIWASLPAIDILQLDRNEGGDHAEDLKLLFAASGDPRNIFKTIASIPVSYTKSVHVHVNDRDFDILARNAILLLVALTATDTEKATECMIHVWYSARIRVTDMDILRDHVRPLIQEVCTKISGKAAGAVLGKKRNFTHSSLRLVLEKAQWDKLLKYLEAPSDTLARAQEIRTAVTLAPNRQDLRDLKRLAQIPAQRVCEHRFREHGILLPFGCKKDAFIVPNPTLYQRDIWPIIDTAGPIDGWSLAELMETDTGPAVNDMHGKVFRHVQTLFASFHERMTSLNMSFEFSNLAAVHLVTGPQKVPADSFARVEVSNMSEHQELGCAATLTMFGPLLQNPLVNPHATLLMHLVNAVDGAILNSGPSVANEEIKASMGEIQKYIPGTPKTFFDPLATFQMIGLGLVQDSDMYFQRFMAQQKFPDMERLLKMKMKEPHTIVDKWPVKLQLQPGQAGAQEEFMRLFASCCTSNERHIEWKRVSEPT